MWRYPWRAILAITGVIVCGLFCWPPSSVKAARVDDRSVQLSSASPSVSVTYQVRFTPITVTSIGSLVFEFCSNNPIESEPCTQPSGFDIGGSTLSDQQGNTGFSIDGNTTVNRMVLSRTASLIVATPSSYTFTGVINPSGPGTHYLRISVLASTDGSGSPVDFGGVAFAIVEPFNVSTEVPPYLTFCAGSTIDNFDCGSANQAVINMGDFLPTITKTATSHMVLATNAGSGYSITVTGTTLTSGTNTIPALATPTIALPGVGQFGINLVANTSPVVGSNPLGGGTGVPGTGYNQANLFKFSSGDIVASGTTVEDYRKYIVSYAVNVASSQNPGIYTTTLSFIAVANF